MDSRGLDRAVLAGASMGAATTLAFTLEHPGAGRGAGADHPGPLRAGAARPGTSWHAGTRWRTGSSATASRVSCARTATRRSSSGSGAWS